MSRVKINVTPEQFLAALADYQAKGMSATDADIMEWAWGHLHAVYDGDHYALAAEISYDGTVLYKVFRGRYEAALTEICNAFRQLRKRAAVRVGFIETPTTRKICEALDYARDFRSLVTVVGETGRSKTTAVREWQQRNNHGRSIYVRCVSGMTRVSFVRAVAKAAGIGVRSTATRIIEERLFNVLGRKTLIIDEAGHLIPTGAKRGTAAIEFVRDMHDIAECGVCLVMTDVYLQQLRQGTNSAFFEQFLGRIGFAVKIPRQIFRAEVDAFCTAFLGGGKPDKELIKTAAQIAKMEGKLRTLADDMAKARQFALASDEVMGAKHLRIARKWRQSGGAWNLETV